MAWRNLTKKSFPNIKKKQYLFDEYEVNNYAPKHPNVRISTYRSKAFYIIAIDSEHRVIGCTYGEKQLDDRYILRFCQAEHMTWTDIDTGKLLHEDKGFYCDTESGVIIDVNDKNLKYCKYKQVRLESILE